MVEGHVAVICVAVAALALAAAALGIVGEATKSKATQSYVRYDGASCVYRRTPAFGCGVAAAASLLTGQLVLTAAAGCWGRYRSRTRSPSGGRRAARVVVFSALLSWFLAALAASAFLVGALKNQSGERRPSKGDVATYYRCTVLVVGVFAGGSFLAIAAAAVGIGSYVALESEAAGSGPPRSPPVWCGELRSVGLQGSQPGDRQIP
ncbi:unnamed protein product [Urochloa decumbens]|uniref:Uncharacterized protein n=1 Tax=Urochloa decumbens TaxID=240449 RepID=A0ABC8W6W7_9POAL